MKNQVIYILLAFLIENIDASINPRIIGGENTHIENSPHQVSLRLRGQHFCGGCIISEWHILTAAHCVNQDAFPYQHLSVHTGTSSSSSSGNTHRIASITIHPEWSPESSFINDIAVVKLAAKIHFNEQQQKIKLVNHDVVSGMSGILTGWGHTTANNGKCAAQLQKLQMTLLSSTNCQPQHAVVVDKKQLCAYHSRGHGACFGDSGSPLVTGSQLNGNHLIGNVLVGIVSWTADSNCESGKPEIFTNIYAHRDFITSEMNK